MRVAVHSALATCAVAAMLACSPETESASPVGKTGKPAARAGAGGVGGMARAGAGGQAWLVTASPVQGSGGTVALAVAAPSAQPMAAEPAPASAAPAATSPSGPTAAIARVEPLARKPSGAGGAISAAPANGGVGGAGLRPPLTNNMQEQPSAELCERLQMATAMRPLPGNERLIALLAACAVLQQPSAAGAAAPGSGGRGGANAGDLPADDKARDGLIATAVFTHAQDGIALLLVLDGCKDGAVYPVHIHAGHSCVDQSGIGDHWDRTRGDDIPDLRCNGSHVAQEYVRSHTADKPWTLGGPSVSDVIGHALVIGDPADRSLPLACGVILAP